MTTEQWLCPYCEADVTDDEEIRGTGSIKATCPQCGRLIYLDGETDGPQVIYRAPAVGAQHGRDEMSREITHRVEANGYLRQIVTPERLRAILEADGDSYERPDHFGGQDEWMVDDDQEVAYRIKPEFLSLWGDCDEHTVVTASDIAELANTWDCSVDELMEQVEATQ